MRPACRIEIDGAPAGPVLMERIQRCEVRDRDGDESDTVTVDLVDQPPAAIPRRGAAFRVFMGYGVALSYMGAFEVEDIEIGVMPSWMSVTGRMAELFGVAKTNRERHWDDVTISEVVEQIAGENGWRPIVDPAIGAFRYTWLGQINESDVHFLRRLADRHAAIFTVKNRALIFAARGSGSAPSGVALTPVVIRPGGFLTNSCVFRSSDRTKYASIIASYPDRATGERRDVEVVSDPDGTATLVLNEQYADEAEARAAAEAMAQQLARSEWQFRVMIPGDPTARAGAPLTFLGVRPGLDGRPFVIETATHSFDKGGYTTTLDGRLQG